MVGWMFQVEVYRRVQRAVMVEGMSIREASRVFNLHRDTVRKMLAYSAPPGYRRQVPPRRPKLEPFTPVIDRILENDLRVPRKQRHTAKRIFERLRDEHGFGGGYTIVKDYVREHRRQAREMFVPLSHSPGHAQCDFGEALVVIGGVEQKAHCFVLDLPHSDGCFIKAYPAETAETTEAFLDGHVSAFAFLGGVPQSILYDNTKLAVARILGDGHRKRTEAFSDLQSHYLFDDRFGRPGKGNDKGKVEGLVGYMRRNFLVPVPSFASFEGLNAHLERRCLERMDTRLRGRTETIGQRLERDLEALLPLPPSPYDACDKRAGRVSSLSLVRYRTNDYSVPVAYGHRDVIIRGYVAEVVISCGSEVIARHPRSYVREDFVYDPIHYLPLLEQKTAALDQAAPLQGWDLPEESPTCAASDPYMAILGEPLKAMVQNLGRTDNSYALADTTNKVVSQGFTTGPALLGYRLQGIGVNIEGSGSNFPDGPTSVSVAVHADSSGKPGAKLVDLVSPTEYAAGHSFFEAPPGTYLAPSTSYVLVWRHLGGTVHRLQRTSSDSEDLGGLTHFSIANVFYRGADLDNLSANSGSNALEIAVYGEINRKTVVYIMAPPPPAAPAALLHTGRDRRRRRHPQVLRPAGRKLPHVRRRPRRDHPIMVSYPHRR